MRSEGKTAERGAGQVCARARFVAPWRRAAHGAMSAVFLAMALSCVEPIDDVREAPSELGVGETRTVTLRHMRFDVERLERVLTREDLAALPSDVKERLWLLDLDLSSRAGSPRLLENALLALEDADDAELSPAARNLRRLLQMTPDDVAMEGTSLEELIDLAPLVGLAPSRVLADLLGMGLEERFLSTDVVTEVLLERVIGSHPNLRVRKGPRTPENPEGLYPVTEGAIPVTIADILTDFASLADRYGEVRQGGEYHPGFVAGESRARILTDAFAMRVRTNANALPWKGVDLSRAQVASVNSLGSQYATLFDFSDPDWLVIEGLVEGTPLIEAITFRITEDPSFLPAGTSRLPRPRGNSEVWTRPVWTLEHAIAEAGFRRYGDLEGVQAWTLPGRDEPVLRIDVRDGWKSIETSGGVGTPPAPAYVWDVLCEIAQVRLHDGGLAEGEANVEVTLRNIPVGIDARVIEATVRANLEADPRLLAAITEQVIDTTWGEADFFYVHDAVEDRDDLVFVIPDDIPRGDDDRPVRPWTYRSPGFFADAALQQRRSVEDAEGRERVRVESGDVLYVEDDAGWVYRVDVGARRGRSTLPLEITRIR